MARNTRDSSAAPRLTDRQRQIVDVIQESLAERSYPPSMREIGDACGLASLSSVTHQLARLQELGYLRRVPGRPRAMEVLRDSAGAPVLSEQAQEAESAARDAVVELQGYRTQSDSRISEIPMVGQIAAGGPILADQQVEDIMPLPRQLTGEGELFMLQVRGDSMIEAGIFEGDWVVVRRQNTAENGDIVAALLDDEATVKTLKRRDGHVWLLPQNRQYEPILGDESTIMGKVVTVLRSL
ncbi:transcriptional repressor LexA [Nesterenkonia sp. LB17]|uniref:transcriptional repressor LexA n=1 Tax=unclassified Nesterenkonia TaxID=2629769 RepID=UPI001F4C98F0|nr:MULTISPECIES: transcriptional repressor LexA [unclassified Nesterenkonia]MCH8559595.1 transcriptional repressor LexA [Nesterenkonia sp. DZ6]MCH8561773.1 transcriptional repressor LexA [Nesterenkonia sp. YGD6]MCH8564698.1 transcriptional repressor LexA [Nesterenkonia sp. LB17]MCH8570318.1 transcriptional repressor LexA [Nesterenkonia sp. AY15]